MRPHVTQLPSVKVGTQTWLYGQAGSNSCATATLDLTKFGTLSSAFPNGYIPSGVALGKITADGTYGIYNGGSVAEVQTITISATGGTFTVAFDGSPVSTAVAWNATGATLQAALEALSTINPGDVTVSGPTTNVYTITFGGRYVGKDVPALVTNPGSLTGGSGTAAVATTTAGEAGAATDGRQTGAGLLFNDVTWRDSSGAALSTGFPVEAMFIRGVVREVLLPTNHGVDAAFKADVGSAIQFV
jgi:hypothetical protein